MDHTNPINTSINPSTPSSAGSPKHHSMPASVENTDHLQTQPTGSSRRSVQCRPRATGRRRRHTINNNHIEVRTRLLLFSFRSASLFFLPPRTTWVHCTPNTLSGRSIDLQTPISLTLWSIIFGYRSLKTLFSPPIPFRTDPGTSACGSLMLSLGSATGHVVCPRDHTVSTCLE